MAKADKESAVDRLAGKMAGGKGKSGLAAYARGKEAGDEKMARRKRRKRRRKRRR
jgi:hypothetical protein